CAWRCGTTAIKGALGDPSPPAGTSPDGERIFGRGLSDSSPLGERWAERSGGPVKGPRALSPRPLRDRRHLALALFLLERVVPLLEVVLGRGLVEPHLLHARDHVR